MKDVAFAVPDGAKVTAGQQIAWIGDSGDANGNPHLHFEVHPNDGADVDPVQVPEASEQAALRRAQGRVFSLGLPGCSSPAGPGAATVEVDRVRRYPGGRWLDIDPREVELTVPLGTDVARALDQLTGATLRSAQEPPMPIAAFTLKANATPEAIVGAPGELLLGRVAPAP